MDPLDFLRRLYGPRLFTPGPIQVGGAILDPTPPDLRRQEGYDLLPDFLLERVEQTPPVDPTARTIPTEMLVGKLRLQEGFNPPDKLPGSEIAAARQLLERGPHRVYKLTEEDIPRYYEDEIGSIEAALDAEEAERQGVLEQLYVAPDPETSLPEAWTMIEQAEPRARLATPLTPDTLGGYLRRLGLIALVPEYARKWEEERLDLSLPDEVDQMVRGTAVHELGHAVHAGATSQPEDISMLGNLPSFLELIRLAREFPRIGERWLPDVAFMREGRPERWERSRSALKRTTGYDVGDDEARALLSLLERLEPYQWGKAPREMPALSYELADPGIYGSYVSDLLREARAQLRQAFYGSGEVKP